MRLSIATEAFVDHLYLNLVMGSLSHVPLHAMQNAHRKITLAGHSVEELALACTCTCRSA